MNSIGDAKVIKAKNRAGGHDINESPCTTYKNRVDSTPCSKSTLAETMEAVHNPIVHDAVEFDHIRHNLLTDSDLDNLPMPKWIVKNLIPSTGVGQIYGPSGSGKTFLSIHLAACLAHGYSFFGYEVDDKIPVVFIELEGISSYPKRIKAINTYLKLSHCSEGEEDEEYKFYHWLKGFQLNNEAEAISFARDLDKGSVLFIDTQAMSTLGINENDTGEMAKIIDTAKRMASIFEGFVFLIHHSGKSQRVEPRGSSVQYASMDVCIKVESKNNVGTWTVDKLRDGEAGQKFNFKLQQIELEEFDENGEPVTSCVAVPMGEYRTDNGTVLKTKSAETRKAYCKGISDCVANSPDGKVTKAEINSYLKEHIPEKMGKCPRREINRYIEMLIKFGTIKEENGLYSLNID